MAERDRNARSNYVWLVRPARSALGSASIIIQGVFSLIVNLARCGAAKSPDTPYLNCIFRHVLTRINVRM